MMWPLGTLEVRRGKFSSTAVFASILAAVLDTALMFAKSCSQIVLIIIFFLQFIANVVASSHQRVIPFVKSQRC